MDVSEALLDSWDRQSRIVTAVASRVTEENRDFKPAEDSWSLDHHLAHIHKVRHYFLNNVDPERGATIDDSFIDGWETPIDDLSQIKVLLEQSGSAIRDAVSQALSNGVVKFGWYDNPVLFLQHMIWHEGWHVGLVFQGLRNAGQEPPQAWEEANVWDLWRTEEW